MCSEIETPPCDKHDGEAAYERAEEDAKAVFAPYEDVFNSLPTGEEKIPPRPPDLS